MKEGIVVKMLITLLVILFLSCSYSKSQTFIQVDFQDLFEGEKMSFYVNGTQIFKKQKLYTASMTGETGFSILFTRSDSNHYFITQFYPFESKIPYRRKKVYKEVNTIDAPYQLNLRKLKNKYIWIFKVEIENGLTVEKEIDIQKGNYIGVTNYDSQLNDGLFIVQSNIPFAYD